MKSSFTLLTLAGMLVVGCAGSSPIAPSASPTGVTAGSSSSGSEGVRPSLPPVNPAGISCPSDAPQVMLGSLGLRLDIEFSEVTGAFSYEIEILHQTGDTSRLEIAAPANRAEWYGRPGLYRVRVRTINCGGVGNWSGELFHALDAGPESPTPPSPMPPSPPPPGPGPTEPGAPSCSLSPSFDVQSTSFVFNSSGSLKSGTVSVGFSNAGAWQLQLVASSSSESSSSSWRATGGTVKTSAGVTLACGQASTRSVNEGAHPWKYWWFRVYRNGSLVYTSDRFTK